MSHCDDYCCNQGCNQGRDCPARKPKVCPHCYDTGYDASGYNCTCGKPAKVAKVGKRMQAAKSLNASPWRRQLKDLARGFLLMLAVMLISAITVGLMR
ncbi:hypothetical protein [Limnohabitans sp.]|uniref:hypothetical protein n=1 Tax=Limnohabitans sp. TaxID=1907725 RepID=UPI0025B8324C|nr:hypothetical protein [Limnohabitans sp.]